MQRIPTWPRLLDLAHRVLQDALAPDGIAEAGLQHKDRLADGRGVDAGPEQVLRAVLEDLGRELAQLVVAERWRRGKEDMSEEAA
jgi:hypothetical protein